MAYDAFKYKCIKICFLFGHVIYGPTGHPLYGLYFSPICIW